jgi:hydrogenase maturation protein HypF
MAAARVAADRGIETAALSGGVAINTAIRTTIVRSLESAGIPCLMNERHPLGDGCISFGQCVMAAALVR